MKANSQIKITPKVKAISNSLEGSNLEYVFSALDWLKRNLKLERKHPDWTTLFRARTASEIIESGFILGCTDMTLAFIALANAKGIETTYVEAIRKNWLESTTDGPIKGHIFVELTLKDRNYIVDSEMGRVTLESPYKGFVIYKRGKDSWNIGIKSREDLTNKFNEFKKNYQGNLSKE